MKRKNRFPRLSRSGMFYPVSGEKLTHVPNVSLTYEMQVVMLSCSGLPRQKEISYRACRLAKDDLGRTLQNIYLNHVQCLCIFAYSSTQARKDCPRCDERAGFACVLKLTAFMRRRRERGRSEGGRRGASTQGTKRGESGKAIQIRHALT